MDKGNTGSKWATSLKMLGLLLGLALIILGVYNFLAFDIKDPINVVIPIYYILFGLLIIGCEINFKFIVIKFYFLREFLGRGMFYFFVGTLCLRQESVFQYIMAAVLMAVGVMYWILFCACRNKVEAPAQAV
mmetsp:Transcript_27606/g.27293  ORF Transcript_27606/g.27293 Transcript_27606/m.27293 type:complete len:132 (+) Transcript_27606:3-398(+)